MKKNTLFLVVCMLMSTIIFAQRHGDGKRGTEDQVDELKKELSLSDEQYNQVKALNQKFGIQLRTLRSDSSKSRDVRREEMKSMNSERKAEMKKILTETQYMQWTALQEKGKDDARQNKQTGTKADMMRKDLSLTDDQYAKIKTIDQSFDNKWKTLRTDSVAGRLSVKADMKNLKAQRDADIKQVLTADQYTKWTAQQAEKKSQKVSKRHSNN